MYWLDTSGSMAKHGFEDAKKVLINEVENAKQGDVLIVGAFDSNEYVVGRLAVGEDDSIDAKQELIRKIISLKATGKWTHIDEALDRSKAMLLEERATGDRKIVLITDGVSDPATDHQKIDLTGIAEKIPHELGWSIFLVGLPEDLEGLFQSSEIAGIIETPDVPNVKGIPLEEFSQEKIKEAVKVIKEDTSPTSSQPLATSPQHLKPELPPRPEKPHLAPKPQPQITTEAASQLWFWLIMAVLLAAFGGSTVILASRKNKDILRILLEIKENDEPGKRFPLSFREGEKKTIGPKGDIAINVEELPPVAFSILFQKGALWVLPMDSISINGKPVTGKTCISVGDRIKIRNKTSISIERGEQDVTE